MRKSRTLVILDITLMLILIAFDCHTVLRDMSGQRPPVTTETNRISGRKVSCCRCRPKRRRRSARCKLAPASGFLFLLRQVAALALGSSSARFATLAA